MACNSCAKPFSLLRKEKGCPSCGFSYCSKCLDNKIFVQKLNAEAKVCLKCKRSSTTPSEPKVVQPPDAYYKRVGTLEDTAETKNKYDPKDQQILERLQKLKEGKMAKASGTTEDEIKKRLQNIKGETPTTSDEEIQARLAKLRGVPTEVLASKPVLPPPDTRTEQEQIDDLMKQYMEQTHIDSKYQDEFDTLISDMESRMNKLKGTETGNTSKKETMIEKKAESEDEEEAVMKIVQKIKAEASFEDDISESKNDELPFCEICNEDARMRCLGCQYLFCKRCFLEHKDDDDGCDRYEPYQAPKAGQ